MKAQIGDFIRTKDSGTQRVVRVDYAHGDRLAGGYELANGTRLNDCEVEIENVLLESEVLEAV
jgi:hypothetical protein